MSFYNPDPDAIRDLLKGVKTIAVVGFSPRPGRPSHNIARAMQRYGFRIIPVRPGIRDGLGEKAWPDLASVPDKIDLVNVFRASGNVPPVVDECLRLGLTAIWMQDGIINEAAAARAGAGGMTVVMDRCILRDYTRAVRGMKLRFSKMQGVGNDFVVFDGISQRVELTPERIRRIADRHFGIGCDQVLLVQKPASANADFRYRIFNADGGEVEQCGNGARCFVRFVRDAGLTAKYEIRVETLGGLIAPRLEANGEVTVDMGAPVFEPRRIPFISDTGALVQTLEVDGTKVEITAVSMGNPHALQVVADVDAAPVTTQGPLIEHHARFPLRVNAGYMEVQDRHRIKLRVWERGAGETLACGTGACAAVAAGIRRGLLDTPVRVSTRGGELSIAWDGANDVNSGITNDTATVRMSGPAETVFQGEIDLDE